MSRVQAGVGRSAMRVAWPSCRTLCLRVLERSKVSHTHPPIPPHCSWMDTLGGRALCSLRAVKGPFLYNLTIQYSKPIELNEQNWGRLSLGLQPFLYTESVKALMILKFDEDFGSF